MGLLLKGGADKIGRLLLNRHGVTSCTYRGEGQGFEWFICLIHIKRVQIRVAQESDSNGDHIVWSRSIQRLPSGEVIGFGDWNKLTKLNRYDILNA
jgi:hypothetical protein